MSFRTFHQELRLLRAGVGQTTQENRVLPFPGPDIPIPPRIGIGQAVPKDDGPGTAIRGFVITEFGAMDGTRFNPYTLAKLETHYLPESAPYAVMPWATDWNVTDTTNWHDVVCFYQDEIRINAEGLPALAIPVATLPGPAVPYVIPSTLPGAKYGDAPTNATQKRVFAVGRDYVKSWGGGGVTVTLGPASPGKQMTVGQRANSATDTATIAKLYFTGTFWDSLGGSWEFSSSAVAMMLAPPYLSASSASALVELPVANYGSPSTSTPTVSRSLSMPATAVGLIGIGEVAHYGSIPYDLNFLALFPWRGTHTAQRTGQETGTSTVTTYTGSASHSGSFAGMAYTYTSQNTKTFTSETTSVSLLADSFPTGAVFNGPTTAAMYKLENWSNVLLWSDRNTGATDRGVPAYVHSARSISNTTITQSTEAQTITGAVVLGAITLFSLSISVNKSSGQQRQIVADNSYYTQYLNNPYGLVGAESGMGMNGDVTLRQDSGLSSYKNPPGYWDAMPQSAKNEIISAFTNRINEFAGKQYFDYEVDSPAHKFYTSTIQSGLATYSATISVSTRDDLLYDEINGVYLWIGSTLTGSQGSGAGTCTLTVTLHLQTRYGSWSHQIASRGYTGTLLPEYQIAPPAPPTAVPSPRLRAFFCPLHRDQGSFKGVSYVTAAEETNGAAPAHLVNFRLKLRQYGDLSNLDTLNQSDENVNFVPCNLLEMLYGFVWSADYGVGAATGERYRVTRQDRFDDLTTHLFGPVHEVHLRDGTLGEWATPIGSATAWLFRT